MKPLSLVVMSLLLVVAGVVGAEPPATQPALKETEPVRANGLDFQLIAPVVWVTPADDKGTPIPLALRVTNRGDTDVHLCVSWALKIALKDAAGKEPHFSGGVDDQDRSQTRTIAKGQSVTLDRHFQLRRASDKDGTFRLKGQFGLEFWEFMGLKPGKYTLSMTYSLGSSDKSLWEGEATTKELSIEIITQPATTQPTTQPVDKAAAATLIRQLGDDDFAVREAATQKLIGMGEGIGPLMIQKAKEQNPDPEVAERIQKVIAGLGWYIIKGKVVDESGRPVANASFEGGRFVNTSPISSEDYGTTTDADGVFSLLLPPGPSKHQWMFRVFVGGMGWSLDQGVSIRPKAGETTDVVITLKLPGSLPIPPPDAP
jgi:hypothetical protein